MARPIIFMVVEFDVILRRLRGQGATLTAMTVMCIKAMGALLSIAAFTLAARAMSADDFGRFAVWFNAVSFLAVAAVVGQDTLIGRSWGEYNGQGAHGVAKRAYLFGWRITLFSAVLFALAVLGVGRYLELGAAPSVLYASAAYLLAQTILHFSSHSSRAIADVTIAEFNRELTWRIVLLLVAAMTFPNAFGASTFFLAGAGGMAVAVLFQQIAARARLKHAAAPAQADFDRLEWFKRAGSMWVSAIVEAASQYMQVILIGQLTTPAVAG